MWRASGSELSLGSDILRLRDTDYRHRQAQKILKAIQKETNSLKRASPADITDSKWKSLEDAMSQYVFLCPANPFSFGLQARL